MKVGSLERIECVPFEAVSPSAHPTLSIKGMRRIGKEQQKKAGGKENNPGLLVVFKRLKCVSESRGSK